MFFFAVLPLLAVAVGGSTQRWSEGLVLGAVGLALLVVPPRSSLGWAVHAILAGLLALSLTAFLPATWFRMPAWRLALTDDLGTTLPATLSPQPWLTAESLGLFLGGIGWFYLMGTVAWTADERPRAGRWFAGGVVVLAAVFIGSFRLHLVPGVWHSLHGFGPFPNRNQTADFLGVGALPVLACAHVAWRGGRRLAAGGWLAGWGIVAAALFHNYSRAGIGILFAGTAAYLGNETFRALRRPGPAGGDRKAAAFSAGWRKPALAASLVLLLASGFMIFGGETLGRLRPGAKDSLLTSTSDDFRLRIQRDTLDMVADSPWCGVGLGSFEPIFATYRERSAVELHVIHPESDWLWMTAELGWPAFALAAAGVILLVGRAWPRRSGGERPLRTAAAIGVAAFALHGFVDVSAHRVGTAWCGLFLLGLALPGAGETPDLRRAAPWAPWLFRCLGIVLIGAGALWLAAERGNVRFPGVQEIGRLTALTRVQSADGEWAAAVATASHGLELDPMDWQLYFQRAIARLGARENHAAAQADFRRALYLEPQQGRIAGVEAGIWARAGEPDLAVGALLEACRRAPAEAGGYFTSVCEASGNDPAFLGRLAVATRTDPELHLLYIEQLPPTLRAQAAAAVVEEDPDLAPYDDQQRTRLFRYWSGNPGALAAAMDAHPAWQQAGWRWWAKALADTGDLARACQVAAQFTSPPIIPSETADPAHRSAADLQAAALVSPDDLSLALRLYRSRLAANDRPGALSALHAAATRPGAPAYFHYLEAKLATEAGQWVDGWDAWQAYLEGTGNRSSQFPN